MWTCKHYFNTEKIISVFEIIRIRVDGALEKWIKMKFQDLVLSLFVYVIGLHAVQFGNIGWEKFWGQPKLDEAIGRVQFGNPRSFFLLPINYIASKNRWTWQIFDPLKYRKFSKYADEFGHYQHKTKPCERRLKAVIIAVIWLADVRFINLSWYLLGWWKVSRFSSNWTVCSKLKEAFQQKISSLF